MGCATTQEATQLGYRISSVQNEGDLYRKQTNEELSKIRKENDNMRQQLLNLSTIVDSNEEKIKNVLGKIDELKYQFSKFQEEMKKSTQPPRKQDSTTTTSAQPKQPDYEAQYTEAFDAFRKGLYKDAVRLFTDFLGSTAETPLKPNAYYWIGESYMNLKDYEKAILSFQEVLDKYPKSEKAPRALLSQAEAFGYANDKKSSITILKKVIELYPKSEEAIVAERKLRTLGSR